MQTLLDSGKYSDLVLHCGKKTWKVHRAILCTSSSVFAAMVDNGFKEAQDHEINLPDDEPEIVGKMLDFVYGNDYDDERELDELPSEDLEPADQEEAQSSSTVSHEVDTRAPYSWNFSHVHDESSGVVQIPGWSEKSLLLNAQMYIIGDKYNIENLKRYSKGKYAEVVEHLWNSPSFLTSAKLLYDNTPQSDRCLRDIIVKTAKKHISTLILEQGFEDVMVSHGDLAVAVLKSVLLKEEETESEIGYRKGKKKNFRPIK